MNGIDKAKTPRSIYFFENGTVTKIPGKELFTQEQAAPYFELPFLLAVETDSTGNYVQTETLIVPSEEYLISLGNAGEGESVETTESTEEAFGYVYNRITVYKKFRNPQPQ